MIISNSISIFAFMDDVDLRLSFVVLLGQVVQLHSQPMIFSIHLVFVDDVMN